MKTHFDTMLGLSSNPIGKTGCGIVVRIRAINESIHKGFLMLKVLGGHLNVKSNRPIRVTHELDDVDCKKCTRSRVFRHWQERIHNKVLDIW